MHNVSEARYSTQSVNAKDGINTNKFNVSDAVISVSVWCSSVPTHTWNVNSLLLGLTFSHFSWPKYIQHSQLLLGLSSILFCFPFQLYFPFSVARSFHHLYACKVFWFTLVNWNPPNCQIKGDFKKIFISSCKHFLFVVRSSISSTAKMSLLCLLA